MIMRYLSEVGLTSLFDWILRRPRVLCADDDDSVRALCVVALRRAGFAVETASDGREAFDKILHRRYAAILLDLRLPHLHGATVLGLLSQQRPAVLRRVILMTGMPEAAIAEVRGNVRDVARKPVQLHRLVAMVKDCCAAKE